MEDLLEKAVKNNAVWCDTICNSHNATGQFLEDVWINKNVVPRFYPNAITLKSNVDDMSKYLQEITLPSYTIKDSYNSLDINKQGYSILFEAEWIALTTPVLKTVQNWKIIKTAAQLETWELTWNNNVAEEKIFLPTLLDDSLVFFLAKYENEQIIAGAIANIASEVVGLSNVFSHDKTGNAFSESCTFVRGNVSHLPIVGYERGADLDRARVAGFETFGKLKVLQIS